MDLSRWMSDLPDADRRRPLEDLILPGSRASLAYRFNPKVQVPLASIRPSVGVSPRSLRLVGLTSTRSKKVRRSTEDWLSTQRLDLEAQLDSGIRSLDLRVTTIGDQMYVSRTYVLARLHDILVTLKRWVLTSREYLEVRIYRDPALCYSSQVARATWEEIRDLFEGILITPTPLARQGLTLENASGKISVVWGLESPREEPKWDIKTISARSMTPEVAIGRVGKYLRHIHRFTGDQRLKVLPLVVDPPELTSVVSLTRSRGPRYVFLDAVDEMRPVVDEYLEGFAADDESRPLVHVIEIDGVDSKFVRAVINLNRFDLKNSSE